MNHAGIIYFLQRTSLSSGFIVILDAIATTKSSSGIQKIWLPPEPAAVIVRQLSCPVDDN